MPGIGGVIAAAVEAFVGDVERFDNLKSFAAYFGMVPRTKQTGDKDKPRQRMTGRAQAHRRSQRPTLRKF